MDLDKDGFDQQWIFTEDELKSTPSILEGLPVEKERENRSKGCNLILLAGVNLNLPQITISSASIFLHRFYMRESMNRYHYYNIAATALFLATKVEENCRKIRDLIIEVARFAQKNPHLIIDEQSKEYWKWHDTIMLNEQIMLELLCFDIHIQQPYEYLKNYVAKILNEKEPKRKEIMGSAWAFLNDSLLTVLNLTFPPKVIAGGAMYFALRFHEVDLPLGADKKEWYQTVGLDLKDIKTAFHIMADLWENNPLKRPDRIYMATPDHEDQLQIQSQQQITTPNPKDLSIADHDDAPSQATNGGPMDDDLEEGEV